jgi:hypothetical protein
MYPAHWIRVSDADREAVVAHLSAATAEGRLTLDEFCDRTQRAYASRTWGELASLVGDLPAPSITGTRPAVMTPWVAGSGSLLPLLALIFGIVSIPASSCMPVGGVAGLVGIVLGVLALRPTARGVSGQRGMALAGLICGLLGVAVQVALVVFVATID